MTTQSPSRWPLERGLFTVAGTVTLIAAALSASHSAPARRRLRSAFGACPAAIVLRRTCRLRSAIYPNPTDNREPAPAPAREEVTV